MPYILFTFYGVYIHPPPPPNKQPVEMLNNILDIIKRIKDPQLNIYKVFLTCLDFYINQLVRFLQSSKLQNFCQQYNKASLAQIHNSFANYNCIAALIKCERLLSYLEGRYFNGVLFKWKTKHQDLDTVCNMF